jgi:hypothetical protein
VSEDARNLLRTSALLDGKWVRVGLNEGQRGSADELLALSAPGRRMICGLLLPSE